MVRYQKKIGAILLVSFSWTVFACATAQAYVLSGPHVLELMISKYGKAKRLRVSQKWILSATDAPAVETELKETLCFIFPRTFRSDLHSANGQRIQVQTDRDALTAIDGKIVPAQATDFDCYKDIFLYQSREILQEKLSGLGVNVMQSSLGRFEDRIAFVLGAQYPDPSCSQVWIDKENFRPIRWLIVKKTPTGQPGVLEINYRNWQLFAGYWYPLQIAFYDNGRLVRTVEVEKVEVNPPFPAALFDINKLRRELPPAVVAAEPPASGGIGEIKKTIEEFKKIYQ